MIINIIILFNNSIFVIFFKSNILVFWGIIMNSLVNIGVYFFWKKVLICVLNNFIKLCIIVWNYLKLCVITLNFVKCCVITQHLVNEEKMKKFFLTKIKYFIEYKKILKY